MTSVICPKGHASSEEDFCSECGARIAGGALSNASPAPAAPQSGELCPDCKTPRSSSDAVFCEMCGYNYETRAHGEIPVPPATTPAAPPPAASVLVTIDPALKEEGSPDPPEGWQPLRISLTGNTALIGRKSLARNIAPEISLDFDTAVSHRHATLTRSDPGVWTLRDLGSSNGTRVNGQDVTPGQDVTINPGDRITLGHWTLLTLSDDRGQS